MRIAIVGCGICGSYLGRLLAKAHQVEIFERKSKIGRKACSGLVSQRLWEYFPKNPSLVENEVGWCEIRFRSKRVKIKFEPPMLVINRDKLDAYSAELCAKAGARIRLSTSIERVLCPKSTPYLVFNGKSKPYDYVIGCDGALSVVRASLGLPSPKFRLGLYTYVKRATDKIIVWPTERGFKWSIPRGERTELGIIERPEVARRLFKHKASFGALIPCGLVTSNNNRIALCGDAAGLTKPWSGGGIIWSLRAARVLAKLDIRRYNQQIKKEFAPLMFYSKALLALVKKFTWALPRKAVIDPDWLY